MNKKSLAEVMESIETLRAHKNFLKDDQKYMDFVADTYFKFAPGNEASFKFGFAEGYFKCLHTYVPREEAEAKVKTLELVESVSQNQTKG